MTRPMLLIMAQVDDVTGEMLGEFLRRVEALGAPNVQIVPSITKKGRPGHIVYVDVAAELEGEVALLLGTELGAWGYRILAAEHRHFDIRRERVGVDIRIGDATYAYDMRIKVTSHAGRVLRVKAEHDELSNICREMRERGHTVPVAVLKAALETRWRERAISEGRLVVDL